MAELVDKPWQLEWCSTGKVAGVNRAAANESVTLFESSRIESKTLWYFTNGNFVSALDTNLVLDVSGGYAKQNNPVNLYPKTGNPNQSWRIEKGYVYSKLNDSFVLAIYNGALVLQKKSGPSQKWMWSDPTQPRPATSCHLNFSPKLRWQLAKCSSWKITLSVTANEIVNDTYFCSIGWPPGGYSGIQQKDYNGKPTRYVIFSFWNHQTDSVSKVDSGPGVIVEPFGGEGTGMKCMKQVQWEINSPVKFEISGKLQTDNSWIVSCDITSNGETQFIASLQRGGPRPLSYVYSFAEDWNRGYRKTGYRYCREAEYTAPVLDVDKEQEVIREARFTKVTNGYDAFAVEKARAGVRNGRFYLATGGLGAWDCDSQLLRL